MTRILEPLEIERFRAIVARGFGLHYEDGKLDYLADVLRQRMSANGSSHFDVYLERLTAAGSNEFRALAEQLTVNETFFFRNADSFRALAEVALPERIRARSRDRQLRILSAGCASGEEPYSLAIVVRESLPELSAWDVRIVALDISPAMLVKARQARYSAWSLRATSEETRRRYFREEGRDFVLDPEIRRMVTFEERNLIDDDPLFWRSLACDLAFCRNVLMYFTPDRARDVVRRLSEALLPGGFFFLGHAETLRGLSHEFHLCHSHDTFYYQRRAGSDAPIAAPAWADSPLKPSSVETLPEVVETTTSWVDAIQRASERIATLADGRARAPSFEPLPALKAGAAGPPAQAARSWDLGLVLEAMRQERYAAALALIGELPADSHGDPDALLLRAVLLTNHGKLEEAEQVCKRLLALDELHAGAHYLMALCREHAGDSKGAVEHDQAAIYLDACFAMPHLHRGIMAKRSGELPTALRELGQASILLEREDASRLLLFGGGFSREMLLSLCRAELRAAGGDG